jgi:hypothetical protein
MHRPHFFCWKMAHFLGCRAERISNIIGGFMKTGLTKKQKVTEFYFNERNDLAEIYTHNADLKKRLLAYAKSTWNYANSPKRMNTAACGSRSINTASASASPHLAPWSGE